MAGVIIKPRSRILHGHNWVFTSEILKTYGAPADGDVVAIKDGRDRHLGLGTFNSRSPIAVRRFTLGKEPFDLSLIRERVLKAIALREAAGIAGRPHRMVWSESDGLPGVVADRYGDAAVLQTLTPAADRLKCEIAEILMGVCGVAGIWERNDSRGRATEGLPFLKGVLLGEPPRLWKFANAGVEFEADLLEGQKTGFYLDQIDAQRVVARYAKGGRVLDCFANQGGFALACAAAGAAEVTAVESGEDACARLLANAGHNRLAVRIEKGDAFAYLRKMERGPARFDLIVLDPPSFSKGRGALDAALRGYRELHLRASRLLAPHGHIATFSCSHAVSSGALLETVARGGWDAGRVYRVAEGIRQPADHPVLPHLPETEYLKGFVLAAVS